MASYTMQLRTYLEMWSQEEDGKSHSNIIETGRPKLFNFDYPIFDQDYKKVFETNFIRNFYMREIGFETEELFKFQLETWLRINMPYWNKMFESELIDYDPLINSKVDVTANKEFDKSQVDNRVTNQTSKADGTNKVIGTVDTLTNSSNTNDDFTRVLDSNNPDSRLTITSKDGEGVIEYASSIQEQNNNGKGTQTGKEDTDSTTNQTTSDTATGNKKDALESDINETEDYIQHRVGKIGVQSYAKLVTDHRNAFLRIEKKIFEEMQQLFMLVY